MAALRAVVLAIRAHDVEALHAHRLRGEAAEVVPDHDDEVRQHQDAALEVVALALAVHVAEEEDAEDDGDEVPLGEEEVECVRCWVASFGDAGPEGRVEDESGDLKEADLKGVC